MSTPARSQPSSRTESDVSGPWWRHPPLRNALIAGVIALAGFVLGRLSLVQRTVENGFYWVAIPLGAFHWAREGIEALVREREVGIEFLMLAATVGSGCLALWDESAALVVLYGIAEGVEEYTFARTRHAIRGLLALAPKEARRLDGDREESVPAEELRLGDWFVVRPGESVATDGVIVSGRSSLDESVITGEVAALDKGPGDKVFSASLNGQGAIIVEVIAPFADNTLSKIIHLVEEAQEQKGPAQEWIERFGRYYSPAVLVSALFLFLIPHLLGMPSGDWARRAVVLLVAAAPCALVISLPLTTAAGIGAAGRRGILIKGGVHLAHLGSIRTVAFDKTGTLTHGKPVVTDVCAVDRDESRLLAIAAGLERNSEHALARAIVIATRARDIEPVVVADFTSLTGAGVRARIGADTWHIASLARFRDLGHDLGGFQKQLDRLQEEGKNVVLLGNAARVAGWIALQDTVRPEAARLIERLKRMDLRTVMLTGDHRRTADRVAERLGLHDVRAGLMPEEKAAAVRELARAGPVLMVGDGINDAPALAAATCGMAMGGVGTDAAIEAADVALMADDLSKIDEAIWIGRKAMRISRQNIAFSLLVLAVLIPAGICGFLNITVAVLAHEGSELLAAANGLRAGRWSVAPSSRRAGR